ncbi:MAG: SDR family NAD(P)-dependent oxidoreductase [Ilumatobacteraceae bacterium]
MEAGQPDPLAMFAPNLFSGTTALVTGGGRGMGKATALGFARYGGDVIIASNEPDELKEATREIEELGVGCLAVDVNIRDTESVDRSTSCTSTRSSGAPRCSPTPEPPGPESST